ncbi:MAG: hypothetical protein JXO51_08165 [Candidatus Aminicenantes bacterium]|nr:hypothetical protein [Candidatus Aminicenantes bacterium]
MRDRWILALLVLSVVMLAGCRREEAELTLLEKLARAPGVETVVPLTQAGFEQAFQVDITQAVDHADPGRGTYSQRFYLSYRGEEAPTVFYTTGYGVTRNYESEPAALLQANQVLLVHRYFPDAVPSTTDWSFLTIAQAAADQHAIREALRDILPGKWISSGASKGGMTALYYRYYFPRDVDATIAYVAPVMERPDDPRFVPFLRSVGSASCRGKLSALQQEFLGRRSSLLPLVHEHALQKGYSFTVFSEAQAFEYAVCEYPFAFWQYGQESDCSSLPGTDAADRVLFDHLVAVSPLSYYADAGFEYYRPLFYQAYTEIGYCPYMFDHLAGLLQSVPAPDYRAFAPHGVEMTFRPEVMAAVVSWLRYSGERIVTIYGGIDPWTAAALVPDPLLDALHVVQPGANHRVKIGDLDARDAVIGALERWLGVDIDETRLAVSTAKEGRERL